MTVRYLDALTTDPEPPRASYSLSSDPIVGEVTDAYEFEPDEGGEPTKILAWRAAVPSETPTKDEMAQR